MTVGEQDTALATEVARAFALGGDAVLTGPVAGGRLGDIWRLETDRGVWAVKETRGELDVAEAEAQASYQEQVLAGGVPTPVVVRTPDGAVSAEVLGRRFRVGSWVDLRPRERRLDPRAVGELVARLHGVVVPGDGPVHFWYADPVTPARWRELVERLERAGAPFVDRLAALHDDLAEIAGLVAPHDPVQWCHRDLFSDNLLATTRGGLCVVDWDEAGPADPSRELALLLLEFGCGQRDRTTALVRAYAEAGGPGRVRELEDFSMAVCVLTNITAEGCRRWLAASTEAQRLDNAAWVAEYLDEPLTVRGLEQLLTWVR